MSARDRLDPAFYRSEVELALVREGEEAKHGDHRAESPIVELTGSDPDRAFTPDQPELRQLLVIKLRSLAADIESGQFGKKYPNAGQIRLRVERLRDIAGVME